MSHADNDEQKEEYKLLIIDKIQEPEKANTLMEVIANNKGDEALAAIIDDMETVDVARLFTEAFDYTKPNQAAAQIKPTIAADCLLAIMARTSKSRLRENPKPVAEDINSFLTSVILTRDEEGQSLLKNFVDNHLDLITATILCVYGYGADKILETIDDVEQGTLFEVASNLWLSS